jgi:hypothetical protein
MKEERKKERNEGRKEGRKEATLDIGKEGSAEREDGHWYMCV